MATYNTLTSLLTAIANAIRSKTGETGVINAQKFPSKIESITSIVELTPQQNVEQETNLLFNGDKVYYMYTEFSNKNRGTYAITTNVKQIVGFGGSGSLGSSSFQGPYSLQSKEAYGNSWSFTVDNNILNCNYKGSTAAWDGGSWNCWVLYTKI